MRAVLDEVVDVLRRHASAVENRRRCAVRRPEALERVADLGDVSAHHRAGGVASRADRPDRLVRDDDFRRVLQLRHGGGADLIRTERSRRDRARACAGLSPMQSTGVSPASIASRQLARDERVVSRRKRAPLGMADDDEARAAVAEHGRRDLAGERARL